MRLFGASPLLRLQKILEKLNNLRILVMLGQNHNDAAAAFDWCLGIFGNRNQHVRNFRIIRVSQRIHDLIFDLFILLGTVDGHQGIDCRLPATTPDGYPDAAAPWLKRLLMTEGEPL